MRFKPNTCRASVALLAAAACCAGASAQRQPPPSRPDPAPKVGQAAPELRLRLLDKEDEVNLADFRGKMPVVLIFGSYT